jgi:hypothetical protein
MIWFPPAEPPAMRSLALVPMIESPVPLPPLRNIPAVVPMIVSDALPPQMALTFVAIVVVSPAETSPLSALPLLDRYVASVRSAKSAMVYPEPPTRLSFTD